MKNRKLWIASIILFLPIVFLYIGHYLEFLSDQNLIPTGFLGKRDSPYYMALAREYFDQEKFRLLYPLPMSDNFNNEPIYFQLHILLFAIVWKITGLDPGTVFIVFGLIAGVLSMYFLLKLFREMYGLDTTSKKLTMMLWVWGGGILSLLGLLYAFYHTGSVKTVILEMFRFDPDRGWWGLNVIRNFIYPTEAIYHLLGIATLYFIYKKQYKTAFLFTLLNSLSGPHSGITFIGIFLGWAFLERFLFKNKEISYSTMISLFLILVYHIGYYLIFLNQNAEHKNIIEAYWVEQTGEQKTGFIYHYYNFIPGYLFLGLMTIFFFRKYHWKTVFENPFSRLLAFMCLLVLALSNHDLIAKAHQPLHFEKGYVYLSAFLLSAPILIDWFNQLIAKGRQGKWILGTIVFIFLFDNLTFFTYFTYDNYRGAGLKLTKSQKEVLDFLNKEDKRNYLLVSDEEMINYWAIVYTPMRSYISHEVTTPFIAQKREINKQLFEKGILNENLSTRKLLLIDNKNRNSDFNCCDSLPCQTIFENKIYRLSTIN